MQQGLYGLADEETPGSGPRKNVQDRSGRLQGASGTAGTYAGQERREKGVTPVTVETGWPTGFDGQRSIATSFAKRANRSFCADQAVIGLQQHDAHSTPNRRRAGWSFHPNPCISRIPPIEKGVRMKTVLKRVVMWAWSREYICDATVRKMFDRFGLRNH